MKPFRPKKYETAKCQNVTCENTYTQKRKWQRFCSRQCRMEQWDRTHPRKALGE